MGGEFSAMCVHTSCGKQHTAFSRQILYGHRERFKYYCQYSCCTFCKFEVYPMSLVCMYECMHVDNMRFRTSQLSKVLTETKFSQHLF